MIQEVADTIIGQSARGRCEKAGGAGHEPIDRRAVLDRVQALVNHVRDRLAEAG